MSAIVPAAQRFPEGTSVSAYLSRTQPGGSGPPVGTAAETQVVSGGNLTYTTLAEGEYLAVGLVSGEWRRIAFTVGDIGEVHEGLIGTNELSDKAVTLRKLADDVRLPFVSVASYGTTADGVIDDTVEIQDALDAETHVYFPSGTYLISASLTPQTGQRIVLARDATIRIDPGATGVSAFALVGLEDVSIEGGELDGNKTANPDGTHFGIRIAGACEHIRVRDVLAHDFPSDGPSAVNGGDGFLIGYTGGSSPDDVKLIDCVSEDCDRQGFSVTGGKRIALVRPIASGVTYRNGIDIEPGATGRLEDCLLEHPHVFDCERGISFGGQTDGRVLMVAPHVHDIADVARAGILVGAPGSCEILAPEIYDCAYFPIEFTNASRAVVRGGRLVSTGAGLYGARIGSDNVRLEGVRIESISEGVRVEAGSTDGAIVGCDIVAATAIRTEDSLDFLIDGNRLRAETPASGTAIRVRAPAATGGRGHLITGNRIDGFNNGLDFTANTQDNRAVGNLQTNIAANRVLDAGTNNDVDDSAVAPAGSQAYTATNVTADRAFNANASSTDELADVLGTLIADLREGRRIT